MKMKKHFYLKPFDVSLLHLRFKIFCYDTNLKIF